MTSPPSSVTTDGVQMPEGTVGAAPEPPSLREQARAKWARWGPPAWTLRTRLVAVVLAMLAALSLVTGAGTVLALRSYLMGQLDERVEAAALRTSRIIQDPREQQIGTFGFGPGQTDGTVIARIRAGRILGEGPLVLTTTGETGTISGNTRVLLTVPVDTENHTRDLGGTLGKYRLRAIPVGDGTIAVTGLPLKIVNDTLFRLKVIIAVVTVVGLIVAALVAAAIVRLTLRPLRRVAATAAQVSTMPLERGEVDLGIRVPETYTDPRTEVGQVGAALNAMLGHVDAALTARQESETRVRRFVADASHELRTPLAAIRGYAELSRRNAAELPEDVAHALARVESQAVRMTGLVEDLLLLASLDSGRPIEQVPVDLSILLVNAVSDAHAAGPGHTWRLDLPDDPVQVLGEAARLTQVFVNLLGNARAHTPPGTIVNTKLTVRGRWAVVTVADNGPGIPETLLPEVFERFARGDSSRSRAAGSTGLGLSIVAAVVAAHQGTVAVESRPGWTEFSVRLPVFTES
jgi:two-component system OmpR family sensor kinase